MYEALWREPVVVALPSDHVLAHRTAVDIADLAKDIFLIAPAEDAAAPHDEVFALCRRAGFTPRADDGLPDVQAALALVAAGLGINPVPAALRRFRRRGVVYRALRPRTLRIELGLAWRRDDDSALKGYDAYARRIVMAREMDGIVSAFMEAAVWGAPDRILRKLGERRAIVGDFEAATSFRFGGTPFDLAESGLRLCAREVLPVMPSWRRAARAAGRAGAAAQAGRMTAFPVVCVSKSL